MHRCRCGKLPATSLHEGLAGRQWVWCNVCSGSDVCPVSLSADPVFALGLRLKNARRPETAVGKRQHNRQSDQRGKWTFRAVTRDPSRPRRRVGISSGARPVCRKVDRSASVRSCLPSVHCCRSTASCCKQKGQRSWRWPCSFPIPSSYQAYQANPTCFSCNEQYTNCNSTFFLFCPPRTNMNVTSPATTHLTGSSRQ